MRRPASRYEIQQLHARYVMPREQMTLGITVQILALGNWPYAAIVLELRRRLVKVEFNKRTGAWRSRSLPYDQVYVKDALQRLRSERAAVPGPAAQEVG